MAQRYKEIETIDQLLEETKVNGRLEYCAFQDLDFTKVEEGALSSIKFEYCIFMGGNIKGLSSNIGDSCVCFPSIEKPYNLFKSRLYSPSELYGMVDEKGIYKKLHTTITALEYNNFGENLGFKLECNDEEERIYIRVMDKRTNTIFNDNIYYTYDKIREVISKKCANIAFVVADTRKNNDKEEFHFTSAKLLTGCTFESFLCAVKDGRVKYDIRIGSHKSGKNKGKVHDHGSGFRIRKNEISSLFNITEL